MDIALIVQTVTLYAIPVLFAITLHEAAHGYVARHYGDPTAWQLGRVTLNPMKHIDPLGTILMPLLLYFATAGNFLFGYAKPVPVNFGRLRNPKRDMVWVALAGPASNLLQAALWLLLLYVLQSIGVSERFWLAMCRAGFVVNLVMFAFGPPPPPLDGGRIPHRPAALKQAAAFAHQIPRFFHALALVVTGIVATPAAPAHEHHRNSATEWLSPRSACLLDMNPTLASSPASPRPARPTWATTSAPSGPTVRASRLLGIEPTSWPTTHAYQD